MIVQQLSDDCLTILLQLPDDCYGSSDTKNYVAPLKLKSETRQEDEKKYGFIELPAAASSIKRFLTMTHCTLHCVNRVVEKSLWYH